MIALFVCLGIVTFLYLLGLIWGSVGAWIFLSGVPLSSRLKMSILYGLMWPAIMAASIRERLRRKE